MTQEELENHVADEFVHQVGGTNHYTPYDIGSTTWDW